jgi:hypothetical protein
VDFAPVLERQQKILTLLNKVDRLAIAGDQIIGCGGVGGRQLSAKDSRVFHGKIDGELAHQEPAPALHYALIGMEISQRAGGHRIGNWSEGLTAKVDGQGETNYGSKSEQLFGAPLTFVFRNVAAAHLTFLLAKITYIIGRLTGVGDILILTCGMPPGTDRRKAGNITFGWVSVLGLHSSTLRACNSLTLARPAASSLYVGCQGEEIVLIVVYKVTFVMEEEHPSSQFL